jgi:hypothetical protein
MQLLTELLVANPALSLHMRTVLLLSCRRRSKFVTLHLSVMETANTTQNKSNGSVPAGPVPPFRLARLDALFPCDKRPISRPNQPISPERVFVHCTVLVGLCWAQRVWYRTGRGPWPPSCSLNCWHAHGVRLYHNGNKRRQFCVCDRQRWATGWF